MAHMGTTAQPRLGGDFVRLWSASVISNLGDGVTMVAGPLLVASLTNEPALVAGAVFAQQLPWLLFSLPGGAYVDRLDRRRLPAEIAEGVGWLWRHRTLRLLAVCLGLMNLTGGGTFAIWVLWARDRLGLQGVGFGALVTAYAVGGLLGTALASRLEASLGPATLLRAGLVVEAASQLSLGLTRTPWVAGATLVAFGAHAMVWGVVTVSLRQRIVPDHLRGRVNSVYFLFDIGGAALGTLLGGLTASAVGITTPFWIASGGTALLTVAAWRRLTPGALASPAPAGDPTTA